MVSSPGIYFVLLDRTLKNTLQLNKKHERIKEINVYKIMSLLLNYNNKILTLPSPCYHSKCILYISTELIALLILFCLVRVPLSVY